MTTAASRIDVAKLTREQAAAELERLAAGIAEHDRHYYQDDAPVTVRLENSMDSYYSVDLRYNYTMPIGDNQLVLTFGALDLFNSDLNNTFDSHGVDSTVSDVRQRRIYGGVTYSM